MLTDSHAPPGSTQRRGLPRSIAWLELLPKGRLLPDHLWQRRHRAITLLLWLHVPMLALFGLARGMGVHVFADVVLLSGFALAAGSSHLSRTVRSIAGSTGLVTCSALLVHIWDGTIEAHFHFFVVVSLLMLYQDWVPFLIAIGYVVVHHGLMGAVAPDSVYSHGDAQSRPWLWALVHGGFVLASATANLVSWRANEQLLRDPLTELPTRLVLHDRLGLALERARRHGSAVAVLFIDVDRFKVINDSLGHATGDRVLRVVSERLRASARGSDVAVRFGGDEFVVVCEDVDGPDAAQALAERLGALLRMPVSRRRSHPRADRLDRRELHDRSRPQPRGSRPRRGHGDVPREGARKGPLRAVRRRDAHRRHAAPGGRVRAARRAGARRAPPALPAGDRSRVRLCTRRRGAAPVAASGTRTAGAG